MYLFIYLFIYILISVRVFIIVYLYSLRFVVGACCSVVGWWFWHGLTLNHFGMSQNSVVTVVHIKSWGVYGPHWASNDQPAVVAVQCAVNSLKLLGLPICKRMAQRQRNRMVLHLRKWLLQGLGDPNGVAHIHMHIITDLEIHVFTVIELVYSLLISKKNKTHIKPCWSATISLHPVGSSAIIPAARFVRRILGDVTVVGPVPHPTEICGEIVLYRLVRGLKVLIKKKVSPLLVALLLVTSMNFIWTSIAYSFSVAGAFFAMPLEGNAEMIVRCPESSAGFVLQPRRCTD